MAESYGVTDGVYNDSLGLIQMLKTYYAKDGLVNLLYRNDPLLKKLKKTRIVGKNANFSALYSRGGAVSANFTVAKSIATKTAKAAEFTVEPGQLFSCCSYGNRELLMSRALKGAYINIAQAKFFASCESFRKTLAVSLYGNGYGKIATLTSDITFTDGVGTVTLPQYAIMAIDIGTKLVFKKEETDTESSATVTAEVTAIDGTTVTLSSDQTTIAYASTPVVCLKGSCDNGPLLPRGLDAWLPAKALSSNDSFFGVKRSVARDRLAGTFIDDSSNSDTDYKMYKTLEKGILALRRMGSLCDMIVMNDEDYLKLAQEIDEKTRFMKVDGGKKGKATVGYDGFGIAISSNFLDNVIDSPYCPSGKAYILDSSTVELWTYTNADKVNDGIADNSAGKPDVSGENDAQNKPYQLLVDDMLSITPGEDTINGPASVVTLSFYGQIVVTNPSVNGVVLFPSA